MITEQDALIFGIHERLKDLETEIGQMRVFIDDNTDPGKDYQLSDAMERVVDTLCEIKDKVCKSVDEMDAAKGGFYVVAEHYVIPSKSSGFYFYDTRIMAGECVQDIKDDLYRLHCVWEGKKWNPRHFIHVCDKKYATKSDAERAAHELKREGICELFKTEQQEAAQ